MRKRAYIVRTDDDGELTGDCEDKVGIEQEQMSWEIASYGDDNNVGYHDNGGSEITVDDEETELCECTEIQ